jgi:hypothetical protein
MMSFCLLEEALLERLLVRLLDLDLFLAFLEFFFFFSRLALIELTDWDFLE